MKKILFLLIASGVCAQAASIDWSGTYRFEYVDITKPSLGKPTESKSYGMHFLTLSPRILASDGISIHSRFDLLTNEANDYAQSQIGQLWGGSGYGSAATGNPGENDTAREHQLKSDLRVRELYVKVEEENGALMLGRAPYQFGLGISHNAGNGLFDHWYDTKDMVAYKFFVGNLSFMPMLARSYDNSTASGMMTQETLLEVMYDNKDAGATLGILFERKNASEGVVGDADNTDWRNALCNGAGTCGNSGQYKYERTNFYLGRQWESFGFKLEGGFQKTKTGVTLNSAPVEIDSYGVAAELKYKKPDSKLGYGLYLGVASGDNPGSANKFEGYQFDRNYDVAMLLFNHRLGQQDFLQTRLIKNNTRASRNSFDDEAISNAGYISLKLDHDWKERWKFNYSVTYAQLMDKIQSPSDMKKDLGVELDASLIYFPRERVQWVNQIGFLMPGDAFKNGTGVGGGLKNDTVIGFVSKAAISF